ncbi:MAG: signal recognition particle-docking protein FtsY [Candidatus Poseidoniaceae archaeon]|jgi:fused signal recognition particle receptor|nr:signal recognition particle-docking protein FtsY [Candidatus Poseidoniaceae archaeon]MDP7311878.1 signal recognition particle-docking protein FtsY [Candidatus Thalassarchaeaceae archaeon]|tara:strand:+ start:1828 stop:3234 length:1407 start_codon:yes stop_codon:yes gene_type:complete
MGLFDRFKKKVKSVIDETDTDALSAPDNSKEARRALASKDATNTPEQQSESLPEDEDEWDDIDEISESDSEAEDEWDDWDEESDTAPLPVDITKKERKRLENLKKSEQKAAKKTSKKAKKRGLKEVSRVSGSQVDLHMMRSTTGRQLVSVKSAPKGSAGAKAVGTSDGRDIEIDLGGGVVDSGGRVIKESGALDELLEELEWALLEADMSSEATSEVLRALRKELIGSRLRKGADLSMVVEASLKRTLHTLLKADYWDFFETVNSLVKSGDTPVVIMMVGVNGTGKTTTAAKIAYLLKKQGMLVMAAAADTFRAGAIEQLGTHCDRIGIRCISSQRGGDAAAIARDAVESAKAKGADIVIVDTAGRMQNKINLMNELNKVHRVCQPHLVLFVGDALAGNDAVDQAVQFQEILKFDGAVLSKMDTDAKGGAGLSIAFSTSRPIVLAGVGQEYEDLIQFDPDWLLNQLWS